MRWITSILVTSALVSGAASADPTVTATVEGPQADVHPPLVAPSMNPAQEVQNRLELERRLLNGERVELQPTTVEVDRLTESGAETRFRSQVQENLTDVLFEQTLPLGRRSSVLVRWQSQWAQEHEQAVAVGLKTGTEASRLEVEVERGWRQSEDLQVRLGASGALFPWLEAFAQSSVYKAEELETYQSEAGLKLEPIRGQSLSISGRLGPDPEVPLEGWRGTYSGWFNDRSHLLLETIREEEVVNRAEVTYRLLESLSVGGEAERTKLPGQEPVNSARGNLRWEW